MTDNAADITAILHAFANSRPEATAIHAPGRRSLTYKNLGQQIQYVRKRLAGWDVGRGDVLACVIPTRPEMAVACLTLPVSATVTPLGPRLTFDVYVQLLSRLRPKALCLPSGIAHPARDAARHCGISEIDLAGDDEAPAGMYTLELNHAAPSFRAPASVQPDIAFIVATSGTSGRRKLVPWTHRVVTLSSRAQSKLLATTQSDVGCHMRPLHLGGGLRADLLCPLLAGSSVVCIEESRVEEFYSALEMYAPTWLSAGFTVLREVLAHAPKWPGSIAASRLRLIRAGSGALTDSEIQGLEQTFGAPVLVALTSTEAGQITHQLLPPHPRRRGTVGTACAGYNEVELFDQFGELCPPGSQGEVVVRGPLVFDGYVDDPKLTESSFFGAWYRTGDLAQRDEDGCFRLVGRIGDLINRGGETITPAEIDAAIESHPGVREAAAFGVPHRSLGEEVVAAVVRNSHTEVLASQIIEQVRVKMGPTRVPRRIYFVDALPRTENGKVRRSELTGLLRLDEAQSPLASGGSTGSGAAPLSPMQAAVRGLWESVLQVPRIETEDDFFLLGGDSLSGARLLVSVKTLFGVDLPIECLFREAATVAGMAAAIVAARSCAQTTAATVGEARVVGSEVW
jgi:oxalate---CoA ligase